MNEQTSEWPSTLCVLSTYRGLRWHHGRNDAARFSNAAQQIVEKLLKLFFIHDEVLRGERRFAIFLVTMFEVDFVQKVAFRLRDVMRDHGVLKREKECFFLI